MRSIVANRPAPKMTNPGTMARSLPMPGSICFGIIDDRDDIIILLA